MAVVIGEGYIPGHVILNNTKKAGRPVCLTVRILSVLMLVCVGSQVTDLGVCELARCLPLTIVVLAGLHNLTDRSIFALANSCPYLEKIYLSGCAGITREAILYLMVSVHGEAIVFLVCVGSAPIYAAILNLIYAA